MGFWGAKLYQSDIAQDVQDECKSLLRKGLPDDEVISTMLHDYADTIEDMDEGPVFWVALADTLWDYGRLNEQVREKAVEAITSGAYLAVFDEGTEKQLSARAADQERILEKLSSAQKYKQIRRILPKKCPWQIGDIYALPLQGTEAEEMGFGHMSLLLHMCGEYTDSDGRALPRLRVKMCPTSSPEEMAAQFDALPYLRIGKKTAPYGFVVDVGLLPAAPPDPIQMYDYQVTPCNMAKQSMPKSLMYIGNKVFTGVIEDEHIERDPLYIPGFVWKSVHRVLMKWILACNPILSTPDT